MRTLLLTTLLLAMSFAGCLDGGDDAGSDGVTDSQLVKLEATEEERATKPAPRFEPTISIWSDFEEYEPASNVFIHFNVTDREDNPYPATFLDWGLFYERSPTPVAEGDGNDIPGSYNRTLFGEAYHLFALRADDGQGFKDTEVVIVQTGEPNEPYPSASRILEMVNKTLKYYGEWEPPVAEDGTVVVETGALASLELLVEESILTLESCSHVCNEATAMKAAGLPATFPCAGLISYENGLDCAWVELHPGLAGAPYSVGSDFPLDDAEAMFMDACHADANYVGDDIGGGPQAGVVPEGARCLVAWEYAGAASTIDFLVGPWTYEYEFETIDAVDETINIAVSCSYAGADACDFGGPQGCVGFQDGFNGLDCAWIEVSEYAAGTPFEITSSGGDPDVSFYSECDAHDGHAVDSSAASGPEKGTIPMGTGCMIAWEWGSLAGASDITFHVDAWKKPLIDPLANAEFPDDPTCRTDHGAIAAGPYYYMDALPGGFWIYEESNGVPGLQRGGDDGVPHACVNFDTIIF